MSKVLRFLLLGALAVGVIFAVTGCSFGSDPEPTQVNTLHEAGEQIVLDSQRVFGDFMGTYSPRLAEISEDFVCSTVPAIGGVIGSIDELEYYLEFMAEYHLFEFTPGEYDDSEITGGSPSGLLDIGTWEVYFFLDGVTVTYTRTVNDVDGTDTVVLALRADGGGRTHDARVTFPSDWWTSDPFGNPVESAVLDDTVAIAETDSFDGFNATIHGELNLFSDAVRIHVNNARIEARVAGGGPVSFIGDVIFNHYTDGTPDYITGTLTTPTIKAQGRVDLVWAYNSTESGGSGTLDGHVAERVVVDGTIYDNGGAGYGGGSAILATGRGASLPRLNGILTLEVENAASYDATLPYGPTNYYDLGAAFEGEIQLDGLNKFAAGLSIDWIGFHLYQITGHYTLTDGGMARNLTVDVSNSSASLLHVVIGSDWGPATLDLDASFTPDIPTGSLTDVTGDVTVGGTTTGTASLTAAGIRIDYDDDTYEIF